MSPDLHRIHQERELGAECRALVYSQHKQQADTSAALRPHSPREHYYKKQMKKMFFSPGGLTPWGRRWNILIPSIYKGERDHFLPSPFERVSLEKKIMPQPGCLSGNANVGPQRDEKFIGWKQSLDHKAADLTFAYVKSEMFPGEVNANILCQYKLCISITRETEI